MNDLLRMNIPNELENEPQRSWSDFQQIIFSEVRETSQPILIQAVAGSGKTTTIIEATRYAVGPALFLAFNKAIAEDIKGKLPRGEAKTINALGHRLWMQNCPYARLDAKKLEKLVEQLMDNKQRYQFGYTVQRLVGAAKSNGYGLEQKASGADFEKFIGQAEWADIDDENISEVAELTRRVFEASRSDLATFDFDDQIYGPIFHRWMFPTFGTVLVDEAQDLNRIQHLFVERLSEAGARIIAVGDRHQAIYAFRGALSDSLDLLKDHFRMLELPLSISYRCPLAVIREAQALVPHIQARPGAPEGRIYVRAEILETKEGLTGLMNTFCEEDPELFQEGWLVVCRNNAPLFACIMRHVRARRPCRVLSNALEGLGSFIKKFRTSDPQILLAKLARWREKEISAAEAKGMDWKVAAIEDKVQTIYALSEGFGTVEEILNLIRSLSEGRSGPIFSTIHKAKGLEADHVYFLRPDLVPGWWVREPAALQQEYNLRYVAITRAKQTLTYGVRK